MPVPDGIIPSLLLPEVYGPWKAEPGFIIAQVEQAAKIGFYRSIETAPIADSADHAALKRICADHGIQIAMWLTQIVDDERLDLTAVEESLRQRSVETIKQALPQAIACGATTVAFVGGPDPGPALRQRGYDSFVTSLSAICAAAADLGVSVMFEPLDRFAHKKRLVGPTDEAVAAIARVRENYPSFGLAFDTAHAALNEEDIEAALTLARNQIVNLHLSNAILDKTDQFYGDHHMMPGAPGFLTVERAARIVAEASLLGIARDQGLRVAVEARAKPTDRQQSTASIATDFLKEVFAQALSICRK